MTLIADRGLFVRLLVQPGRFEQATAESFADALDAAAREPATKADLTDTANDLRTEIAAVRTEVALQGQRMDAMEKRLDTRIDSVVDKLMVRLGALIIAASGAQFAALRLIRS